MDPRSDRADCYPAGLDRTAEEHRDWSDFVDAMRGSHHHARRDRGARAVGKSVHEERDNCVISIVGGPGGHRAGTRLDLGPHGRRVTCAQQAGSEGEAKKNADAQSDTSSGTDNQIGASSVPTEITRVCLLCAGTG